MHVEILYVIIRMTSKVSFTCVRWMRVCPSSVDNSSCTGLFCMHSVVQLMKANNRIRTDGTRITNALLYQLSYIGLCMIHTIKIKINGQYDPRKQELFPFLLF